MGIELSSFRTAVAGDGQWLSVQSDDMSKVVGSAGRQEIDVSDLQVAQNSGALNKAANNIYMRGQLLEGIRGSLSSLEQTDAVKTFLDNAEKTLFGELEIEGKQYGVDTASQDLSSATVKDLLDQLDNLTGTVSVKFGTKENVQVGEWQILDLAEEDLTTVQKDLRANCPNTTGKQRSALINLDRAGLAKCLGLSGSAAKQLQVQSVKSSGIEGFLACTVSGPNNRSYDVLVDQAGVFFRKDQVSADQVEADYKELCDDLGRGVSMTADRLAVTKSFAYSDVKAVSGLLKALGGIPLSDAHLSGDTMKGVLVNKLHAALDQTRAQRTPDGSVQDNIVTLWKSLGIKAPVPKKSDPELAKKFFTGLQRTLVDEQLDALNVGVSGSREDKNLREDIFKFLTLDSEEAEYDSALQRLGFDENQDGRQFLVQLFMQAGDVCGVPYDLRLKCMKDPSYLPGKSDCFVSPSPVEDVGKFLEENTKINCVIVQEKQSKKYSDVEADSFEKGKQTEYKDFTSVRSVSYYPDMLSSLKGLEQSRYRGVQFKLTRPVKQMPTEQETVRIFDPNTEYKTEADKAEMSIKPLKDENFSNAQICQLLRYTNNGYLGVFNGLGMRCDGRKAVFDVSKDKNGDMRVVARTPSTRYGRLEKTGNTHRLLMRTTENDFVNEFVIHPDGTAKFESFRFEQNPDRKGRTSMFAL